MLRNSSNSRQAKPYIPSREDKQQGQLPVRGWDLESITMYQRVPFRTGKHIPTRKSTTVYLLLLKQTRTRTIQQLDPGPAISKRPSKAQ